jgi:F0F1-type ATP synthase delta subunit
MRVSLDEFGSHGEGYDVITVHLDNGKEIMAQCIVADAQEERGQLEKQLMIIIDEAVADRDAEIDRLRKALTYIANAKPNPDCQLHWDDLGPGLQDTAREALENES